jgi:hypothetical protein
MDNFAAPLLTAGNNSIKMPQSLENISFQSVQECHIDKGFVRPAYGGFCFSGLPGFIEQTLLGSTTLQALPREVSRQVGRFDHVVFVFLDAFGWESFERFRDSSALLQHFDRNGLVLQTTSQFPSTTAAHVTTACSGLPAFEHEVCGWDYFHPTVGRMIKPLKFALSNQPMGDSLISLGFRAEDVLPQSVFLPNLMQHEVFVRSHGPAEFYPSTFNTHFFPNGEIRGFSKLDQAVSDLCEVTASGVSQSYQMLYIDEYDLICHDFGVGANESDAKAMEILRQLEEIICFPHPERTLLIISADHGQITDKPDGGIAINRLIPGLEEMLKRDRDGEPIYFSGGQRHLCLHPRAECEASLLHELRQKLSGAASVLTVEEMFNAGLLGPQAPQPSYIECLGSIGILPYPGYSVYWDKGNLFKYQHRSKHGGVSPQEMITPLLLLPLGG